MCLVTLCESLLKRKRDHEDGAVLLLIVIDITVSGVWAILLLMFAKACPVE